MLFLVLLVLLVAAYLIYDTYRRYDMIKYGAKIPGYFALPFIGNYLQFWGVKDNKDLYYLIRDMVDKYTDEGICRAWVGQTLAVIVFQPSHLEIIAGLPETSTKGPIYESAVGHTFGGVVISPGGPRWRDLRKPVTLSMKVHYIENMYFEIYVRRSNDYLNFIKHKREGEFFDCLGDMCALFLDIFAESHIGVQMNGVWDRRMQFSESTERVLKVSFLGTMKHGVHYWQHLMKLSKKNAAFEADKRKSLEFLKWLYSEREKVLSNAPKKKDGYEYYTDFLLRRRKELNLSEEESCRELADIIEAGADTSSLFTASALLFLAMHPEIQEKAYQEQLSIFGDSDRDPTFEDINSMKYLEMIFKETGRHVSSPGSFRSCTADIKLDEYTIPKGSIIFAYFVKVHRDPKYWDRPNEFYPEHFLPEKEEARPKYAYVSFGFGLRMCAGKLYGLISVLVTLSTILRKYKVTTPLKYQDISFELLTFAYIQQRYYIKFEKRSSVDI